MSLQKNKTFRSKKYLQWVKSLPSCLSHRPADDPHHIKDVLFTGSTKPHDLFVIPLTRDEHTELHNRGGMQWELMNGRDQAVETIRTISKAIDAGVIEIKWVGE